MTRDVSPAAAAAVSRLLAGARIRKAVEVRKGWESEGYAVAPRGDHVRVEYVPNVFAVEEGWRAQIEAGLAECFSVLHRSHYEVRQVEAEVAFPGEFKTMPVLEVRRESWTTR